MVLSVVVRRRTFLGAPPCLVRARRVVDEEKTRATTVLRLATFVDYTLAHLHVTDLDKGFATMRKIFNYMKKLDGEVYYRTKDQRIIQRNVIQSLVPYAFGPAYANHSVEILERLGIERVEPVWLIPMPRQAGKSEGTAQLICVLLLCVERIRVIIITPTMTASGKAMGMMASVLRVFADRFGITSFYESSERKLIIKRSATDLRTLLALPGGAKNK